MRSFGFWKKKIYFEDLYPSKVENNLKKLRIGVNFITVIGE